MENIKVRIKIYGKEYVIAGEKTREHIVKVAEYVDSKMRSIEKSLNTSNILDVAILSAVNITSDYFSSADSTTDLKKTNEQLEKDISHYVEMWEDAKRSFLQYKEDAQAVTRKKDTLKNALAEKEQELIDMKVLVEEAGAKAKKEAEVEIEIMQEKLKETENNFFDLQMENVQLKDELERVKKMMG